MGRLVSGSVRRVRRSLRRPDPDLRWLFVLTFPNAGSTALASLLASDPGTVMLTRTGEGQRLIPAMHGPERWDPRHPFDLAAVRRRWELAVLEHPGRPRLVVEKSPPNMCRIHALLDVFADRETAVITLVRDPYAVCSSWAHRYWRDDLDGDREALFGRLGESWLERAEMLLGAQDVSSCLVAYEALCADPEREMGRLRAAVPMVPSVATDEPLRGVKDYGPTPLTDMNAAAIERLREGDEEALSSVFRRRPEVMGALGYPV